MRLTFLILAAFFSLHVDAMSQQSSPIVGILTSPIDSSECIQMYHIEGNATSCLVRLYVQWLEQAGLRVVPIPFNANQSLLDTLYDSVNGILFTGGELNLTPSLPYYQTAQYLYHRAVTGNQKGDYMVLWGTCQGFQLLAALAASDTNVVNCDLSGTDGVMMPLNFTAAAAQSAMLGHSSLGKKVATLLQTKPTTVNLHHCRISPDNLTRTIFTALSTNDAPDGKVFVSTMDASYSKLPFFATQWHPERPQWEFRPSIGNSPEAVRVSQHFANFFRRELAKSTHAFPSEDAANAALIYNYRPVYAGGGVFNYFFNF